MTLVAGRNRTSIAIVAGSLIFFFLLIIGYIISIKVANYQVGNWMDVQEALRLSEIRKGWIYQGLTITLIVASTIAAMATWLIRRRSK